MLRPCSSGTTCAGGKAPLWCARLRIHCPAAPPRAASAPLQRADSETVPRSSRDERAEAPSYQRTRYTAMTPETDSNPAAAAAPPEVPGGEATMADALKTIDAAPTALEQKLQCICLNKAVDLENPQVRAGCGVAVVVGLIIFFAPLFDSIYADQPAAVTAGTTAGSGYGTCSTAATRRELAQLTRSSTGNTGVCVGGAADGSDASSCTTSIIQVFPFALQVRHGAMGLIRTANVN